MNTLEIKFATVDDVPVILRFIKELAEYEKLSHEVVATEKSLCETLFSERAYAEVIIAYYENEPVGFALFFHNYSTFLGKQMLTYLAKLAKERNCGRLEGSVLDWNEPSIKFYKRIGAEPMSDWTVFRVHGKALDSLAQPNIV